MQLSEIQEHRHYAPMGKVPVCGFATRVAERSNEPGTPQHPLSSIQRTTDVGKVTCRDCFDAMCQALERVADEQNWS